MERLFKGGKGVIPACDVSTLETLAELSLATSKVSGIRAYKIGLEMVIRFGLTKVTDKIRGPSNGKLPVIYDHQKGGTDIPELGTKFAAAVKEGGADAVILFPFGGAETERAWIGACQEAGLAVLVGGHMTQKKFLKSEGGFIDDFGPFDIYRIAAENGVRDFVVPGNKPDLVKKYREFLEGILGVDNFSLSAPGFISQGGDISETGRVAGNCWNAIVGGAIYNAGGPGFSKMREAAVKMTSQIIES